MSRSKQRTIKSILGIILFIVCYFLYQHFNKQPAYEVPEGTVEFHFIDVGQGDAELILTDGKAVLIDTGDKDGKTNLVSYLAKYEIKELEYFVITHFDADHFASASYVLDNYKVKNLIIPDQTKTTNMFETFMDTVEKHTETNTIVANDIIEQDIDIGGLELKFLAPLDTYSNSNDNSVVIMARYGNRRVLLTGDAEEGAEEDIYNKYRTLLDCDILKVGHHGSETSSSEEFLRYAKPEIAVISCGEGNKYGHPRQEALDRLKEQNPEIEIYRTDLEGDIVFSIKDDVITNISESK